jgi:hypothetical protein
MSISIPSIPGGSGLALGLNGYWVCLTYNLSWEQLTDQVL